MAPGRAEAPNRSPQPGRKKPSREGLSTQCRGGRGSVLLPPTGGSTKPDQAKPEQHQRCGLRHPSYGDLEPRVARSESSVSAFL